MELDFDRIIGIDPGVAGGIAVHTEGMPVTVWKMPREASTLAEIFAACRDGRRPVAFIEKVNVRPDDVSVRGNKADVGKLYRIQRMLSNYEAMKALLEASGIPFVMVHPSRWQTALGIRKYREEKRARKNRYKAVASSLYGNDVDVTLWNADALLIMHFGLLAVEKSPKWVEANLPGNIKKKGERKK